MAKKILLADDSVTIQKVVELTLSGPDFEVVSVGSGDDAIDSLSSSMPDLLIADVHMPGASGFEVARRAKAARADLPVLLLVGAFEPFDPAEVADCGADGHLQKPFDAEELRALIERWTSTGPGPRSVPAESASAGPQEIAAVPPRAAGGQRKRESSTAAESPVMLSEEQIEAIARRVVALLDEKILRDIAWEVIPDLAEIVIRERLRELETQVEPADA